MERRPLVIAHRGFSSKYPENTWSAFESAFREGADLIELDLVLTRDRRIFVNHDLEIEGVPVRELKLEEARSMVDGSMELTEVLEWAEGKGIGLYLDIKDRDMLGELTSVLKDFGSETTIVVSSADDFPFMRRFKELNDHILTALLFRNLLPPEDMVELSRKYSGDIIHPCWEDKDPYPSTLLDGESIRYMNGEGFQVVCWHEEREDELRALAGKGFWGITTNDPPLLRRILSDS